VDTKDFHLRRFDVEESCSRFGGSCWWLVSNKRCDHQASTFGAGDPPRYIVFYLGFSPFFYLEILKQIKEREKTSAFFLPRFNYKMLGNVWRGWIGGLGNWFSWLIRDARIKARPIVYVVFSSDIFPFFRKKEKPNGFLEKP
jgi:hypothetical protein